MSTIESGFDMPDFSDLDRGARQSDSCRHGLSYRYHCQQCQQEADEDAGPAAEPPWRALEPGEIIQEGDEYRGKGEGWHAIYYSIGERYTLSELYDARTRRPLPSAPSGGASSVEKELAALKMMPNFLYQSRQEGSAGADGGGTSEQSSVVASQGLTLATLCDMVLGEVSHDRSDDALIRGVRGLIRRIDLLERAEKVLVKTINKLAPDAPEPAPAQTAREWVESRIHDGGSTPFYSWVYESTALELADRADRAEAERDRLREALEQIIKHQPCLDGGGCFYPVHDGDGEYVGEQNVDPISVIASMAGTAQEALNQTTQ